MKFASPGYVVTKHKHESFWKVMEFRKYMYINKYFDGEQSPS